MNSSAVFSIPYTQLVHWSSSIQNVSIHYTAHYDNIIRQLISARDPSACPDPCSLPSYKYPLLVRSKIRLDDGTGVRGDTGPEVGTLLSDTVTLISTMQATNGMAFTYGPLMAEPFISPLALTMTPALSSK